MELAAGWSPEEPGPQGHPVTQDLEEDDQSELPGCGADLEFVATIATGGRVKFLSAV